MEVIELNIGGCLYAVSEATLCQREGILKHLLDTQTMVRDPEGRMFLGRNGDLFRYVLDFLRDGELHPPEGFKEWGKLFAEFKVFFGSDFTGFEVEPEGEFPSRDAIPTSEICTETLPTREPPTAALHTKDLPTVVLNAGTVAVTVVPLPGQGRISFVSEGLEVGSTASIRLDTREGWLWNDDGGAYPVLNAAEVEGLQAVANAATVPLQGCPSVQFLRYVRGLVRASCRQGDFFALVKPAGKRKPASTTRPWAEWDELWALLSPEGVTRRLMEEGFDVVMPGFIASATEREVFGVSQKRHQYRLRPGYVLPSELPPLAVVWSEDALRLKYTDNAMYVHFASAELEALCTTQK